MLYLSRRVSTLEVQRNAIECYTSLALNGSSYVGLGDMSLKYYCNIISFDKDTQYKSQLFL